VPEVKPGWPRFLASGQGVGSFVRLTISKQNANETEQPSSTPYPRPVRRRCSGMCSSAASRRDTGCSHQHPVIGK